MNSNEYLSEVLRIVRENFRSQDPTGGMSVAAAALLVKRALGHDQTEFGFFKFKDVLNVLEERGLIRTGPDSKGAFALWLADATSSTPQVAQSLPGNHDRFRPLRNEVWFAFISQSPLGKRFLNRRTGDVRVGVVDRDLPSDEWAEIKPLDPEAEREEARRWIRARTLEDSEILNSVAAPQWYMEFPKVLLGRNPTLAADWKRDRSKRVIETVKGWCLQNSVDQELVLAKPYLPAPVAVTRSRDVSRSQIRRLLMLVLERMSTEELLRLNLPAREVVAIMRPELLD
jgi:hypothetical protein